MTEGEIAFKPHRYTKALLSAIPPLDPDAPRSHIRLTGEISSPIKFPTGCRFHTRCPVVEPRCQTLQPKWTEISEGYGVACHRISDPMHPERN
ncbi:MAG: oligopeptide/dipeptide ABC transporter ATP-binding protein [Synechococcales bacterium]|nr:oligopeptide/dipeptide ABC transporter ATP-binding protein [Synechococcales bacterium]